MSHNYFSQVVTDRWNEAVADPTVDKWVSLKDLTRRIIDLLRKESPDSILIPTCEGVYRAAANHVISLTEEMAA
jgi:hypothetical protein